MIHQIRGVEEGDVPFLSRNLRGSDMIEFVATYGNRLTPSEALQNSIDHSETVRIVADAEDNPMFIYGLAGWTDRSKLIWAMGTPKIASPTIRTAFLRGSRRLLGEWFRDNPGTDYFFNRAHARNRVHLDWLRWCHAELLPAMPYGPLLEEFTPFIIRRTSYV